MKLFKAVLIFGFSLIPSSCSSLNSSLLPSSQIVSGINSQYRYNRLNYRAGARGMSPGVRFYQTVLSKTLGSHCSLYPSDSVYNQLNQRSCGTGVAVLKSMSRFYLEPDVSTLGFDIVEKRGRLYYVDLPSSCSLF